MPRTRTFLLIFLLIFSFTLSSSGIWKRIRANIGCNIPAKHKFPKPALEKLKLKANEAKMFIRKNGFNDRVCFFVDISLYSGQSRFFVYDLQRDTLLNAGLVTHGRCNNNWLEGRKYSNEPGCGCTSLGKYKIGNSYNGKFGLAFKLLGLEQTNNNAFKRAVVLHAHECVPETEVRNEICQSKGCPTVAPGFLLQLRPIIVQSKKPVLLWIF